MVTTHRTRSEKIVQTSDLAGLGCTARNKAPPSSTRLIPTLARQTVHHASKTLLAEIGAPVLIRKSWYATNDLRAIKGNNMIDTSATAHHIARRHPLSLKA
jgi:hypothetical protein